MHIVIGGKTTVSVWYSLPNYVLTYLSLYSRFFSNVKLDYIGPYPLDYEGTIQAWPVRP